MQAIIAIVIGGLLGIGAGGAFGALLGAAIGWLVMQAVKQQRAITALQQALRALTEAAAAPSSFTQASAQASGQTAEVAAQPASAPPVPPLWADESKSAAPPTPPEPFPVEAVAPAEWAAPPSPPPAPNPSPPSSAAPPPSAGPWVAIKTWLFGGNTIVKLGVAILFIGLAFLAKLASEHVQVSIELRLAGIAAVALALLAVGWRLRLRRAGYAQVLQGGAVALLYLTLFVAFRLYGVLAAAPVFALMVAVAALAAALAVLQNARSLAVIGALGGFATPLLISTGSGNHIALFSYYLVLDLGVAAVAWYRSWRLLNLIGFFGTFLVGTAWGVLKYQSDHYASSQAFLIAFFLLFLAIMLMPARQARAMGAAAAPGDADGTAPASASGSGSTSAWAQGCLLFGLPTISFVLQHGLVRHTGYGTALSALVLAAVYVGLAAALRRQPQLAPLKGGFESLLAVATVFITLVIPFALDARSTAGAWALEGAGLIWLGFGQQRRLPRLFGYALLLLGGAAMAFAAGLHGRPSSFFNGYFFNSLMVAAAALAAALFAQRAQAKAGLGMVAVDRDSADAAMDRTLIADASSAADATDAAGRTPPAIARWRLPTEPLLIAWGTLWLVGALGYQIDLFVKPSAQTAAWMGAFSAVALLYVALSVRLRWPRIALPAMGHAPLQWLAALSFIDATVTPLQHGGWWAWPLALLVHGAVLRWLAPAWPGLARDATHAVGVWVLATFGALQGRSLSAAWGDAGSAWPWLGWLVVPAALLLLLPRPASARRWPVSAAPLAYQWLAAALLTAGLLLWTLLANIDSNGSARPLPHVPLLNPLDLGVAVALFAAWRWFGSAAAQPQLAASPGLPIAAMGVTSFVWLNAMLIRAFHHHGGVAFQWHAWMDSLAVQTGITLLWTTTALALMWLAARRALRTPWMLGAGLLAAVVVKLVWVDLSGSGSVTRIVSFIGVGALMLVIGYVAPLPAKGDKNASA